MPFGKGVWFAMAKNYRTQRQFLLVHGYGAHHSASARIMLPFGPIRPGFLAQEVIQITAFECGKHVAEIVSDKVFVKMIIIICVSFFFRTRAPAQKFNSK